MLWNKNWVYCLIRCCSLSFILFRGDYYVIPFPQELFIILSGIACMPLRLILCHLNKLILKHETDNSSMTWSTVNATTELFPKNGISMLLLSVPYIGNNKHISMLAISKNKFMQYPVLPLIIDRLSKYINYVGAWLV